MDGTVYRARKWKTGWSRWQHGTSALLDANACRLDETAERVESLEASTRPLTKTAATPGVL
jgi:hypothetical protein